jgi:hypothetical protein
MLTNSQRNVREVISQTAHGFALRDVVRHNGTTWVKAQADAAANVAQGLVVELLGADAFVLITHGAYSMAGHGLTVGEYYWLSQATAGLLTGAQPASGVTQGVLHVRSANILFVNIGTALSL